MNAQEKSERNLFFCFFHLFERSPEAERCFVYKMHPAFFIYALQNLLYNINCVYNLSNKGE